MKQCYSLLQSNPSTMIYKTMSINHSLNKKWTKSEVQGGDESGAVVVGWVEKEVEEM